MIPSPFHQDLPGILGPATQFVETDPEFPPLIPFLLDHCWFAETLADARQLVAQRPTLRVVTRDGHICEPGGVMAYGGYRERYQIVSRRSELRKLRSDIERASAEYELDDQRLAAYRTEREASHQQLALASQAMEATRLASNKRPGNVSRPNKTVPQPRPAGMPVSLNWPTCNNRSSKPTQVIWSPPTTSHSYKTRQRPPDKPGNNWRPTTASWPRSVTQMPNKSPNWRSKMARWQQTVTHRQEHVVRWEREQSERDALEFDLREQAARRALAEQMERALFTAGDGIGGTLTFRSITRSTNRCCRQGGQHHRSGTSHGFPAVIRITARETTLG